MVNGTAVTSGPVSGGSASASLSVNDFVVGSYGIGATYNAGSGFSGSSNAGQSPSPALVITKANADCDWTAPPSPMTAMPTAPAALLGVDGDRLAGLDLGASFTDVPGGTADWTFTDVTGNYNDTIRCGRHRHHQGQRRCGRGTTVTYDGNALRRQRHGSASMATALGRPGPRGSASPTCPGGTADWTFTDVTGNYNDTYRYGRHRHQQGRRRLARSAATPAPTTANAHGASGPATASMARPRPAWTSAPASPYVPGGTADWTFTAGHGNYNDASRDGRPSSSTRPTRELSSAATPAPTTAMPTAPPGPAPASSGEPLRGPGPRATRLPTSRAAPPTGPSPPVSGNYNGDKRHRRPSSSTRPTPTCSIDGYTGTYDMDASYGASGSLHRRGW